MRQDDESLFEEAMRDVRPVAGPKPVRQRRRAAGPQRSNEPRSPSFQVEWDGAQVRGLAEGRRPRLLSRLRGGAYTVGSRLDLHGFTEEEARHAVEDALASARQRGVRCVLVIHGRGLHSTGGPILKRALPDWLTSPSLANQVVAFVTAPDSLGGVGATLVLLRPSR